MEMAALLALAQQFAQQPAPGPARMQEAQGHFPTTCGRFAAWRLSEPFDFSAVYGLDLKIELYATEAETVSASSGAAESPPKLGYLKGQVLNREAIRGDFPLVMDDISRATAVMAHDLFTTTGELLPSIRNNKQWIDWGTVFSTVYGHDRLLILDVAELQPALRGQGLAASLWRDVCRHLAQREAPIFHAVACSMGFLNYPKLTPKDTDCAKAGGGGDYGAFVTKTMRPCGFRCFKEDYFGCAASDFDHASWNADAQDVVVDREPKRPREDEGAEEGHPALRTFVDNEGHVWKPAFASMPQYAHLFQPPPESAAAPPPVRIQTSPRSRAAAANLDALPNFRRMMEALAGRNNAQDDEDHRNEDEEEGDDDDGADSAHTDSSGSELPALEEASERPPLSAAAQGQVIRGNAVRERPCTCGHCTTSVSRNTMDALAGIAAINADIIRQEPRDVSMFAARPSVTGRYTKAFAKGVRAVLIGMWMCLSEYELPTPMAIEAALHDQGQIVNRRLRHFLDCGGRIGAIVASVVQQCEQENTAPPIFGISTTVTPELEECDRDYDWATLPQSLLGPGAAQYFDTLDDLDDEDDFQDADDESDDGFEPPVAMGSG